VNIVSWNTRELLADCLSSVRAAQEATPALEIEVLVVDNASTDGSVAMVRQRFPEVRLIENPKNLGFAAAANATLQQATGTYVLLLNSDTTLPSFALQNLCAVLDARPDAVVCGPFLLNRDGSSQPSWASFPGPRSEWTGNLDRTQSPYPLSEFQNAERRSQMAPFPVDWIGAACFLARREAIERVGLLDEGFFFYGEEVDLCHRLHREFDDGCGKILLVPSVSVTHLGGQSSRGMPAIARRHLFYSSLRLYRKLYGVSLTAGIAMGIATIRYILSPLRRWRKKTNQ
jgi:N-acetylglucosaminyl-diphospho-decaprenol L-rhamnosyltransferase